MTTSEPDLTDVEKKKLEIAARDARFKTHVEGVMAALGDASVQEALTVLASLTGQLVVQLAKGAPGALQPHIDNISKHVLKSALNKIMYDDQQRRSKEANDNG